MTEEFIYVILKTKLFIELIENFIVLEIGALRGLIGKSGVIPARSRHCNGKQTQVCATETLCLGKVWASDDPEPGELPI